MDESRAESNNPFGQPFRWPIEPAKGISVGQRYYVSDNSNRRKFDFDGFLARFGAISKWPIGREVIHARAYRVEGTEMLELSGQRAVASPDELSFLQDALKTAHDQITTAMTVHRSAWSSQAKLSLSQEFVITKLPRWLEVTLTTDIAAAGLGDALQPQSTVAVSNGILSLGPEDEGTLDRLQKYLTKQFRAAREGERLDRIAKPSALYAPWTLVVLLLGTWFLRLESLTLLVAAIAMTIPIGIMALQAWRSTGWRLYLLRPGAVTAIALYFICLFGVAYGICALPGIAQTPPIQTERLGNSFLIATSMGLAGGVVGDSLSGLALRVAHVQLLLFLSGLTLLIAKVLRIDALLRDRQ